MDINSATPAFQARIHWTVYLHPLAWMAAGSFCYAMVQFAQGPTQQNMILFLVGSGLFTVGLVKMLCATIYRHTVKLELSKDKVIAQWGIFRPHRIEYAMNDINTVIVEQSPLDRLLNTGAIEIRHANKTAIPVMYVANPHELEAVDHVGAVNEVRFHGTPIEALAA